MSGRRSWNRRSAQEPGAAVRYTLPGRAGRSPERQFGARMQRSRRWIIASAWRVTWASAEAARTRPSRAFFALGSRQYWSPGHRAQPERPVPPLHILEADGLRGW